MPRYLAAKAVEHAAHLDWARHQLANFREKDLPHYKLLDRLEAQLANDAQTLREIEISLTVPGMRWVAEKACYTLHASLRDLSENYIAGLLQQGKEELRWRELLLATAHRIGLVWIEDILVRLDRDLSIIPARHQDHAIPVFFAPPSQHHSVLSLPGIFHEFGHCVVSKHRPIIVALDQTISDYFGSERLKLGPMLPDQRKGRLQQIDDAISYWSEHRLVEVFCDIFATYTCGAVNVLSMVDLARGMGMDPHSIDYDYPPNATRISASYHALTEAQQNSSVVVEVWDCWQEMARQLPMTNRYKAYCPPKLISRLATRSVELIATYQPGTPRRSEVPLSPEKTLETVINDDLCEVASSGMGILWHHPHCYEKWKIHFHAMLGFM
jgi:hypothetical protein